MGRRKQYELTIDKQERIDNVKREICYTIRRLIVRNRWSQKRVANLLNTSESAISRVVNLRVEQLTLTQLFRYLAALEPKFRVLIAI